MGVNIRTKGANGERELAQKLNELLYRVCQNNGWDFNKFSEYLVQRNQNQSAVGGCDLVNTWGLAIEVKRHETLAVNTWWQQCKASALRLNREPVLIYRQSRRPWQVVMQGRLQLPDGGFCESVVTISFEDFTRYYEEIVAQQIRMGINADGGELCL
jgi:hypothetical protein|uniref:HOLLIDAY JUNCTION RESOLVASE, ENZYME, HOMOLOGOUS RECOMBINATION, HOLLIDAY n=1 Tax=Siphoviridae sp. ctJ7x27 TaxID=2827835 RepID=A0A8S5S3T4_9CAUD|nr:MAG TPA: HOLLIDAY JUNCTION RESOLVASE, ENZYME, HOMOLOGOUS RECOMBINATION, HOLLIDAY [Caudoviricetes sp.]DAF45676.1 MAG TPA: HOLLIDAY JUNCTION RESOLVASE, ENZYME, HOMOLOGOUS RECOMBINATION, HOLLIDAY [Siphoviridae sp. ctJ7x27]DAN28120.1 MAG TPA: HOLLIDAY JUNCTION RESOLVASE, ENZYME, HOMOLOGOUS RECOMBINATION, HOLLIDAY [Caudoviricetes sp.]